MPPCHLDLYITSICTETTMCWSPYHTPAPTRGLSLSSVPLVLGIYNNIKNSGTLEYSVPLLRLLEQNRIIASIGRGGKN